MPEMHLKQLGFTYSACRPFTRNKWRIQKFKETEDTKYIYGNELDKACFNMIWLMEILKFSKRAASHKILGDKVFDIAKNPKYDGCQRGLASMVYNVFNGKSAGSGVNMHANNKIKQNQRPLDLANYQLSEELHKLTIKKFKKEQFILNSKRIFRVLI